MALALPIIGGMLSQNVLNLVDTAMVGTLGDAALAAVGFGSFVNFFASAFVLGLSAGVQTFASRQFGADPQGSTAQPLNGGLLLAVSMAVPWCVLLAATAPFWLPYLIEDEEVVVQGIPYLRARLLAMPAMAANFAFRAYWNATNRSAFHFRTLLVMHSANVLLNALLIFGMAGFPRLGAFGAGLASALATYLGTVVHGFLAVRHARQAGFLRSWPEHDLLRRMLHVSVPAGVQQAFFAGGMTAFLFIVGRMGTAELAATNVLLNLVLLGVLPGLGFGLAAASLVGQALGRRDAQDARRWGWDVVLLASVCVALVSVPALVVPRPLLSLFIHERATLAMAVLPLRVVAASLCVDTVGLVLMQALIGAGDTRRVMVASVMLQWLVFLPAAWMIGPTLGLGLAAIWLAWCLYRLLQTFVFACFWQQGRWAQVRL